MQSNDTEKNNKQKETWIFFFFQNEEFFQYGYEKEYIRYNRQTTRREFDWNRLGKAVVGHNGYFFEIEPTLEKDLTF